MLRRIHPWLPGVGCVLLGSRGSDGKNAKSFWNVGIYALGCHDAICLMWLHNCGSRMFAFLLFWDGC